MKEYLKNNPEQIEKILTYYGYHSINITDKEIRCAKIDGNNPSGCRIKLNDNLSATDFTTSYNGDLFSLIATHTDLTYGEIIKTVKTMLTVKVEGSYKSEENTLFDNFFNDIYLPYNEHGEKVIYDPSILDQYSKYKWNKRFLDDGILPSSQYKFHVGYDEESNRISLPWKDSEGNIIGIIGRIDSDEKTNYKYLPLIAFEKHKFLYGLYENKEYIKKSKEVYLFESEKSVLLGDSLNYRNFLALGGNNISTTQVEQILKLGVNKIIISLDEGLDVSVIKRDIKTIKDCLFMRECKIGVILDKENKYLPKGSKASPIDLKGEIFEKLKSECLIIN